MIPAMKRHAFSRAARFLHVAAPACLLIAGCRPVEERPSTGLRFSAPLPEARRAAATAPENAQWLAAWRSLRETLEPLEQQLASAQQVHIENHFDAFLELDPDTLANDQLCSLFHFLQRGYFTVERQILIDLLERRLRRAETPVSIPQEGKPRLKDRLAAAMQRDELRLVDLDTALEYYRQPGDDNFQIPESLTDDELEELRTTVSNMLDTTRASIAEMDNKLAGLKARAFPESFVETAAPAPEEEGR